MSQSNMPMATEGFINVQETASQVFNRIRLPIVHPQIRERWKLGELLDVEQNSLESTGPCKIKVMWMFANCGIAVS